MLTIALPDAAGASWKQGYDRLDASSVVAANSEHPHCCCHRIVVVVVVPGNAYTQIDSLLIKKPSKMASALRLFSFSISFNVPQNPKYKCGHVTGNYATPGREQSQRGRERERGT